MTDYIPEPIKNLGSEAKDIILERLKNPFINLYLFFLIIYNWDIILYLLFSKDIIELKIQCIKNDYNKDNFWLILNWRFITPLIYSMLSNVLLQLLSLTYDYINNPLILIRYKVFCKVEIAKITEYKSVIKVRTKNKEKEDFEREIKNLMNKNEVLQLENEELTEKLKNNLENTAERRIDSKLPIDLEQQTKKNILDMIFDGIDLPKESENGQFKLIDYIFEKLQEKGMFRDIDLAEIIFNGLQNLYFETENKGQFDKLYEENIKLNSNVIISYLLNIKLIKKDYSLSSARNEDCYELKI